MSNKWENAFNFDSDSDSDENEKETEKDYYSILGISKPSSQKEIKKSYRQKARKLHPDKHPDETEKYKVLFQELCEAYSILSDPNKKELYDKDGIVGIKKNNFLIPQSKQDLERLFQMAFDDDDEDNKNGTSTSLKKPQCAPMYTDIELLPLVRGSTQWNTPLMIIRDVICTSCEKFDGKIHKPCWKCGGKGTVGGNCTLPEFFETKTEDCFICESKGHIKVGKDKFKICPKCHGDTTITTKEWNPHSKRKNCPWCGGRTFYCQSCKNKGVKREETTIDVVSPSTTKHNEKRIYYGYGAQKKNHENGDVIVTFKLVGDHSKNKFIREDTKSETPGDCKQM